MATANYVQQGARIDYTPAADVACGDVVVQGDLVGIATQPIGTGALGSLAVEGVFDFPKATGAGSGITAGATVYWHADTKTANTTAAGGKLLGKTIRAAADADATVRVRLTQ